MVKNNVPQEDVIQYELQLEDAISKLSPIMIYLDQKDVEFTFKKAVKERPKEWSEGFIDYYTNQGYGQKQGLSGMDGWNDSSSAGQKGTGTFNL